LDGKSRKTMRHSVNRLERDGYRFELVDIAAVPALLPQLRAVSDAWLDGKSGGEKGFSLGFFDEDYLRISPIAVVRHDTEVVAFANLWQGGGEELSVDLMRYRPDSAQGVMDYLFIRIMLWGREQGFAWFNLGMAPLSGLQNRSLAPLWNRFGALVFGSRRGVLQFSGFAPVQGQVRPPMGSALSGGTGRHDGVAEGAGGPDRADCPRLQRSHRTITTTTQDQSCVPYRECCI
jgi:phosphatidylglycerol lysyltransferase